MFWGKRQSEEMLTFMVPCGHCHESYELVIEKKRTQIIRGLCPACSWVCYVESTVGTAPYLEYIQQNMLATMDEWYGKNPKSCKWNFR